MNLRPFFCYYGGKWRAAPKYPAPMHDTIAEPFAGAAGYATRYHDRNVCLFDKDPVIAGLWDFLIRSSTEDILRLPLVEPGELVGELPICQEAKSLIGFWCNAGSVAPCNTLSKWARDSGEKGNFWGTRIRSRIALQVPYIKHWQIFNWAFDEIPNGQATWYVDPPYQRQGKYYVCSAKEINFPMLADWCTTREGQTIVCEQEGADWLPFTPFATIQANPSKHGKGTCNELIWYQETN
jgi:hypothetical protein